MAFLKSHAGIIVLCTLFVLLSVLRINDRSLLTPDSAQYLIWGNSLAQGKGFVDDTHPITDEFVNHGPLYSLLIAPVELVAPLSLPAVKAYTIIFGVAALVGVYLLLLRLAGKLSALVGVIFFACNPLLLLYSTEVLSDVPFIAFLLLSLYCFFNDDESNVQRRVYFVLMVSAATSVVLLREIGLALPLAYAGYYILRKNWKKALVVMGIVLAALALWNIRNHILVEKSPFSQTGNMPWILDNVITPQGTSLFIELPIRFWHNFKAYSEYLFGMMLYPTFITHQLQTILGGDASALYGTVKQSFIVAKFGVFFVSLTLCSIGAFPELKQLFGSIVAYARTLRRKKSSLDQVTRVNASSIFILFGLMYLWILFLFPFNDARYMLPLVPFLIYYSLKGAKKSIAARFPSFDGNRRTLQLAAVALALMLPNAITIGEILVHNARFNASPVLPWKTMGDWIQRHTPPDCAIASPIKDLAIVVGDKRKVLDIHPTIETPRFEYLLRDFNIGYLLSPTWYDDATVFDMQENASTRLWLEHQYSAGGLHLFKVHSSLREGNQHKNTPVESGTISGMLSMAQQYLMNEQYAEAKTILAQALLKSPQRPDVIYQNIVCAALTEDEKTAYRFFQQLTALPSDVGIFVAPAQRHLETLRQLLEAKRQSSEQQRAVQLFDAASTYWKIGFTKRAFSLMKEILTPGTEYFTGLLWGTHYAIQLHDREQAKRYLTQLETLERMNPIVQTYRNIITIEDSIFSATSDTLLTRLHLRLGSLYLSLELPDEAFDEAELALRTSPGNHEAMRLIGSILEKKSLPVMAKRAYQQSSLQQ